MDTPNGKFVENLRTALDSAFSKDTLSQFVRFRLDANLETIVNIDDDFSSITFNLIRWAESESRIPELISKASDYKPKHIALSKIAIQIVDPQMTENIQQLKEKYDLSPVLPLVEKLDQMFSAKVYSPSFYNEIISILPRMQEDIENEKTFDEMITDILSEQSISDDWKDEFNIVIEQVKSKIEKNGLEIGVQNKVVPIILMVMSDVEAEELNSGDALAELPNNIQEDFNKLKEILEENGVADWSHRYGENAKDWQPFGSEAGTETVEDIVTNELEKLLYDENKIITEFYDIKTLNLIENRRSLMNLRQQDCIVIVDIISICHPYIHSQFQETVLDVFENTFVFSVAPVSIAFERLQDMSLVIQTKLSNLEFYKRKYDKKYNPNLEAGTCQELHDKVLFEANLVERIERILQTKQKTGIHKLMFKEVPQ